MQFLPAQNHVGDQSRFQWFQWMDVCKNQSKRTRNPHRISRKVPFNQYSILVSIRIYITYHIRTTYIYIYDIYIYLTLSKIRTLSRHLPSVLFPSPGLSLPLASCWDCPPRGTSSPPAAAAAGEVCFKWGKISGTIMCKGTQLILTYLYICVCVYICVCIGFLLIDV